MAGNSHENGRAALEDLPGLGEGLEWNAHPVNDLVKAAKELLSAGEQISDLAARTRIRSQEELVALAYNLNKSFALRRLRLKEKARKYGLSLDFLQWDEAARLAIIVMNLNISLEGKGREETASVLTAGWYQNVRRKADGVLSRFRNQGGGLRG